MESTSVIIFYLALIFCGIVVAVLLHLDPSNSQESTTAASLSKETSPANVTEKVTTDGEDNGERSFYDNPQNSSMLLTYCLFCQETCGYNDSDVVKSTKNEIDNYVYGLSYSRDQVLAYKGGSKYSEQLMRNGTIDDEKKFIVITREKKTAENSRADIGVLTSLEHRTFPGSLLLANQRLMDNMPDVLAIDRAPLTYTINLPGLVEGSSFTIIPSFAEYQSSREKVLKTWFDKHQNDNVIANFKSEYSFAYSKELLKVKFGLEFANTDIESSINFSAMENLEQLIIIYKFKQIFYTVSVEPTKKPSDLFASSVNVKDLERKTNNENPPLIVDSVSYGRVIYVKVETSSVNTEAKFILSSKLLSNGNLNGDFGYSLENKLANLKIQLFVMGGGTGHIDMIKARSFRDMFDVIVKYSKFSSSNLGYPISYSADFIRDNSRAVVTMNTDYYETSRTIHSKGIVKIVHTGWFVMKWYIYWSEVNYAADGSKWYSEKEWDLNGHGLTASFERELELPGNAVNIRVKATENTGLVWEGYRTVIDRSGIPLIGHRTFSVWGTTLNPKYDIYPEYDL